MNQNSIPRKIPNCICCNSNDWRLIYATAGNDYGVCSNCNYYIQAPEVTAQQENKFEEEQLKHYDEDSLMLSPLFSYLQLEATEKRFSVLQRFLSKGKLIEVGPGNGDVLAKAKSLGYDIEAVEHSESLANAINKRFGIKIKVGAFEDQNFGDDLFDAFLSFHVIEHVLDVITHLKKAQNTIKIGGFAFIATPNADSWEQNTPYNLSPNYSTAHLQLFSKKGLTLCLEQTGWEVVEIITPAYTSSLLRVATGILRKLKGQKGSEHRGEYIKSPNPKVKTFVQIFSYLSYPIRRLQESLKKGNELFIVAKRVK
jgi:2-polyprenyl-3-methyl-5-hydroxy-6-metoxy-1,4-benzoquinol methylase